jgi:hypothetical protein
MRGTISALLRNLVLRPINDLVVIMAQLERRTEFLFRDAFDDVLRPPLFGVTQAVLNATRPNQHLAIAEERRIPDEERCTQEIIDEISGFVRDTWLPGAAQRFGNTKTYGVIRGTFEVHADLPAQLQHGIFESPRVFPAWVRFSGPGPYAPPDIEDIGQCSVAIKLMGVPGPKFLPDEASTQDLLLVSPASFVTPNVRENAKLQRYVRNQVPLFYFINPFDHHLLAFVLQALYTRAQTSPLEIPYYSNVPFLLGDGQAVVYSLKPRAKQRTKVPARPSSNYLREAMVRTLRQGPWVLDFMVQVQTDPHRMPIEDATVKWPEHLSPYRPVATLTLPKQRFDSDSQLAFADNLSFNPWHSLAAHRPLGNQNRARRRMYWELARLRQEMNLTPHIEPTGDETFTAQAVPSALEEVST